MLFVKVKYSTQHDQIHSDCTEKNRRFDITVFFRVQKTSGATFLYPEEDSNVKPSVVVVILLSVFYFFFFYVPALYLSIPTYLLKSACGMSGDLNTSGFTASGFQLLSFPYLDLFCDV